MNEFLIAIDAYENQAKSQIDAFKSIEQSISQNNLFEPLEKIQIREKCRIYCDYLYEQKRSMNNPIKHYFNVKCTYSFNTARGAKTLYSIIDRIDIMAQNEFAIYNYNMTSKPSSRHLLSLQMLNEVIQSLIVKTMRDFQLEPCFFELAPRPRPRFSVFVRAFLTETLD